MSERDINDVWHRLETCAHSARIPQLLNVNNNKNCYTVASRHPRSWNTMPTPKPSPWINIGFSFRGRGIWSVSQKIKCPKLLCLIGVLLEPVFHDAQTRPRQHTPAPRIAHIPLKPPNLNMTINFGDRRIFRAKYLSTELNSVFGGGNRTCLANSRTTPF